MKKSLLLLSGLVAANVAPIQSSAESARPAFSVRAEFFEFLPGDRVITESTDQGTGIRWDIRYPDRQNRVLAKPISTGLLKDTSAMSFRIRGNTRNQLGLQLIDGEGRAFTRIIAVDPQWSHVRAPYSEFRPNAEEDAEARLDPELVTKALLVDYSATLSPQKRGRTLWLTDWKFDQVR